VAHSPVIVFVVKRLPPGLHVALCIGIALCARPSLARAGEEETGDAAPVALAQEIIGFDLTPVSVMLTSPPSFAGETPPPRVQAGPGAAIRLARHRWEYAYGIPVQAGLYVSTTSPSGQDTIVARLETEGGVIIPGTDRRLEVGLAAGAGVVAIGYAAHCDGTCRKGGSGAMISPVVRYLFRDGPSVTIGASLRALVPLSVPSGDSCFGYCTGFGSVMLGGVEFGIGRGASRPGA
jgi:hypothetical protein